METTGWDVSLPMMMKSTAICVADAAVASSLDAHPLIGRPSSENLSKVCLERYVKSTLKGACGGREWNR